MRETKSCDCFILPSKLKALQELGISLADALKFGIDLGINVASGSGSQGLNSEDADSEPEILQLTFKVPQADMHSFEQTCLSVIENMFIKSGVKEEKEDNEAASPVADATMLADGGRRRTGSWPSLAWNGSELQLGDQ